MANPFDQFDSVEVVAAEPNPFDQFDAASPVAEVGVELSPAVVSSDEVPTDDRLQQQPENQPKDVGFMQKISDLYTGVNDLTDEISALDEIGSAPELNEFSMGAFKASMGLLTQGDDDGAMSLIKQNIPEAEFKKDSKGNSIIALPSGEYALNKPGFSGQDFIRGAFDIAAFTPAARLGGITAAAAGAGATDLALQSAGSSLGGSEVDLGQAAQSALLGGAFKGAENLVTGVSRAMRGNIGDDAAEIIEAGQRADVPVMTSDVLQPDNFVGKVARSTAEQTPIAGTGAARASQQSSREAAIKDLTSEATPMYDDVIQSLKRQQGVVKNAAGSRLERTINDMEQFGEIPTTGSVRAIDDVIADLTAKGRVVDEQTVNKLKEYRQALDEGQTLKSLDTLRSDFREQVKGDRVSMPNRSQAQVNKIYSSMTKDTTGAIKNNLGDDAERKWKAAKAVYAQEAQKIKSTRLKNLFDKGDLTPENARNMLMSKKPSEVKTLYQSLDNQGRKAARATVLSDAIQKATNSGGDVSADAFASQLTKLGPQIDILFKGQDRAQLEGLKKLLNATRQAQKSSVATPTGQQLIPFAAGAAAIANLGITLSAGLTVGGLARAYESPPVRDALLKLANTRGSSNAFEDVFREASSALSASVQSGARE